MKQRKKKEKECKKNEESGTKEQRQENQYQQTCARLLLTIALLQSSVNRWSALRTSGLPPFLNSISGARPISYSVGKENEEKDNR
jgi:hypothetical protein